MMNAISLPWEDWRSVIAGLREKGLPSMLEHANVIKEQIKRHGPDESLVRLSLTELERLISSLHLIPGNAPQSTCPRLPRAPETRHSAGR